MGAVASPQIIGRYAIYGKIASGGMASVHFGRLLGAAGFSRTVAIKRLHPHLAEDPEFLSTMIDEARLAARIHHPHVVATLDVVAAEGELLLVMDYVRGESLGRLLKAEIARGRRVPLPIASAIAIGALHGLHAAHEATSDRGAPLGIVHRDVSPQNILVGVDGMARVIDFGIAKAAGRLQTTRQGVIKGKMAYMAPEQIGEREVTRSADVYAMGVVLWEALAGRNLFKADNDATLVAKVLAGAEDAPSLHASNLPAGLDALVMTALAPDPADRFATAQDMAERLLRVVPPAFPTDVGKWVEELAHDALAQRGSSLGEIESSSGRATVPPAERGRDLKDDAPVASQPSSLSVEAPRRSVVPRWRSRRAMLAGALGAGVLLVAGLTLAVWGGATTPTAPVAPAAPSLAVETIPVPGASASEPASASASAEPSAPPANRSPVPPSSHPATAAPRAAAHAAPAAAARPKPGCNPPYVIDSAGDRKYKPECL